MRLTRLFGSMAVLSCAAFVHAQTLNPPFDSAYGLQDLGTPLDVPFFFGGLFILPETPNTLYICGGANGVSGAVYAVPLIRDCAGQISGFAGPGVRVADAPNNDGGIGMGPGGLILYARWPINELGQIDLSTGMVVNVQALTPLSVVPSPGSVTWVPPGFPGAGRIKVSSWSGGQFYDLSYSLDVNGLISVSGATAVPDSNLPGGPEGFAYVPPGSPLIPNPSMIVSDYSASSVSVYDIDSEGNPIVSTRRIMLTGVAGAEGAAIDPLTGAFLFSTFGGGGRVLAVRGFASQCRIACDINADGAADLGDILDLTDAIAGCLSNPDPFTCKDFNQDGSEDLSDVLDITDAIAAGTCP